MSTPNRRGFLGGVLAFVALPWGRMARARAEALPDLVPLEATMGPVWHTTLVMLDGGYGMSTVSLPPRSRYPINRFVIGPAPGRIEVESPASAEDAEAAARFAAKALWGLGITASAPATGPANPSRSRGA